MVSFKIQDGVLKLLSNVISSLFHGAHKWFYCMFLPLYKIFLVVLYTKITVRVGYIQFEPLNVWYYDLLVAVVGHRFLDFTCNAEFHVVAQEGCTAIWENPKLFWVMCHWSKYFKYSQCMLALLSSEQNYQKIEYHYSFYPF